MAGHEERSGFGKASRLQLLIDAVVDYAIYMLDLDGHVVSWNSGAERLKGYTAGEIIGQSFSRFYLPEDKQAGLPEKALRTAREAGRFHAEGWRVRKDGTRFWATVVVDPIHDESGKLIGFAKVTRDITERQLAQQTLLESEQRYRRLVEAVVDYAIFQLDPNGGSSTWNTGAERIKGYTADEIIGQHFSTLLHGGRSAAGVAERALEPRPATRQIRSRRLARAQGRLAVLGLGRHRRDPRRRDRRADRLCQGHARHHRTARDAAPAEDRAGTARRLPENGGASASSAAASRTTSTTC